MAYRRIIRLFCLFGYTHFSIWLSPGCIVLVSLFPLFASGCGLVVFLPVRRGGYVTVVGLSWSSSSSSIFVFATRAIFNWLLHFSHGMGGLLLGLPKMVRDRFLYVLLNLTAPCRTSIGRSVSTIWWWMMYWRSPLL